MNPGLPRQSLLEGPRGEAEACRGEPQDRVQRGAGGFHKLVKQSLSLSLEIYMHIYIYIHV